MIDPPTVPLTAPDPARPAGRPAGPGMPAAGQADDLDALNIPDGLDGLDGLDGPEGLGNSGQGYPGHGGPAFDDPDDPPRRRRTRRRDALALRLPATLRTAAVDPALRGTLALALVALAGAAAAVWFAWSGRPSTIPAGMPAGGVPVPSAQASAEAPGQPPPTAGHGGGGGHRSSPAADSAIVVDVAGLVARPGVVTLSPGSRVADALEAAGGVLAGTDTTGLSLARRLVDGEQILVDGRPGPAPPPAASSGSGASSGAGVGPLDLNTATAQDLDELPGVGPVLAERIIQWREAHGGFTSPEQLGEVSGVGDRRLAELLPLVTVR